MNKIILSIIITFLLSSCAVQKYYSENGRQISKKTYNEVRDMKLNYIFSHMTEQDKNILKFTIIDERIKDSLIYVYSKH